MDDDEGRILLLLQQQRLGRIAMAVYDDKYNEYYDEYNETTAAVGEDSNGGNTVGKDSNGINN